MNQLTVIFLGPQGSGKGTQVQLLKDHLTKKDPGSVLYFTAGTNLRSFAVGEGYTQERIRPLISSGKLIPTFLITHLFSARLIGGMHGEEHIILDGFPRTVEQIPDLDSALQFYDRKKVIVLHISLPDEVAKTRMVGRGREDDTDESILERLRWSNNEASLVDEWFKSHPYYTYVDINGEQSIQKVHDDILAALKLL